MRKRTILLIGLAVAVLAAAGTATLWDKNASANPFHDFLVMSPQDFTTLVDPDHPDVAALARRLKTHEEAYRFVRDEIRFLPYLPASLPESTLREGASSCLGKASLLCSLYRAMGSDPGQVRVVTGIIATPMGLVEHAWVDLEHQGQCMQQDASDFLGSFAFDEFPGDAYVQDFVFKENFCFNDEHFGVISQLNRMKGRAAD